MKKYDWLWQCPKMPMQKTDAQYRVVPTTMPPPSEFMTLPPTQKKPAVHGTQVEEEPDCMPRLRVLSSQNRNSIQNLKYALKIHGTYREKIKSSTSGGSDLSVSPTGRLQ
jgi:hypothetical protein